MKKSNTILLSSVLCAVMLLTGCQMPIAKEFKKMPAEDIDVLTLFAADIAVLKNKDLPPGSKEKYEAAKHLADNVDFTFARNVRTLDQIFGAWDAQIAVMSTTAQTIVFHYSYQDKSVHFNFSRSKNLITFAEVIISP